MNVETHMKPTYTLELTQDEYVAMIAALFTYNHEIVSDKYGTELSKSSIENIYTAQQKLTRKFIEIYGGGCSSIDIIKKIRLDGFKGVLG